MWRFYALLLAGFAALAATLTKVGSKGIWRRPFRTLMVLPVAGARASATVKYA